MYVSSALDTIKKRGTFKAYKEAHKAYVEQHDVANQAKATLALFTAPTSECKKASKQASGKASEKAPKKASGKNRSETEKASQKTKEGAALANAPAQEHCNEYQALYDKATFAKETAKNKKEAAATKMFNSLSAMDGHDRPLKYQLRSTVVSRRMFIRSWSLIAH